ncbi:hypothetical protein [Burkholderia sp. IT-111MI5]|uniref:hypothetical protein n=1 Tax=Burkholderia sp. IT-111MI5 TaxID=3026439 RepID=UPI0039E1D631
MQHDTLAVTRRAKDRVVRGEELFQVEIDRLVVFVQTVKNLAIGEVFFRLEVLSLSYTSTGRQAGARNTSD